jgi:hypothetical protein
VRQKATSSQTDACGIQAVRPSRSPSSTTCRTRRSTRPSCQFLGLLEGATREIGDLTVRFSRYSLPGLTRGAAVEQRVARDYWPIERTYASAGADGLIVTGTEPLTDEPQGPNRTGNPLADLLNGWAEGSTASTLLSCLAAHAAALLFDGIERHTLAVKCSGVFVQAIRTDHPLNRRARSTSCTCPTRVSTTCRRPCFRKPTGIPI